MQLASRPREDIAACITRRQCMSSLGT